MNEYVFSIGTTLFVAVLSHVQAYMSRPELIFGVTVHGSFRTSPQRRAVFARYATIGWGATLIVLGLALAGRLSGASPVLLTAALWVGAFLIARKATAPFRAEPTTVREASLHTDDYDHVPGGLAAALGPGLILGVKALYVHQHWSEVAERVPVHWGFGGAVSLRDRYPAAAGRTCDSFRAVYTRDPPGHDNRNCGVDTSFRSGWMETN